MGGCSPPLPTNLGNFGFFWEPREIWARSISKEVCMCVRVFFFFFFLGTKNFLNRMYVNLFACNKKLGDSKYIQKEILLHRVQPFPHSNTNMIRFVEIVSTSPNATIDPSSEYFCRVAHIDGINTNRQH